MALFRLSISLPDQPGSLGALASAIGFAGGDIRGLVVLSSEGGRGIDDITVAFPGNDPQGLQNARPDRVEPAVIVALGNNPLYSVTGSSTLVVSDPGHGTKLGSTVIFTNVLGTKNIADLSEKYNVERLDSIPNVE